MVQKFSKKELEQLNCSEEEISLVMKYQKLLPILITNNTVEKFSVDSRLLWNQIGKPQGDFSHWVKHKIADKLIKGTKQKLFIENIDFTWFDKTVEAENINISTGRYSLTIDCTKNVGTN